MKTPKKSKADNPAKAKTNSDKMAEVAAFVNESLAIFKKVGIENKPLKHFWLAPAQRDVLLAAPGISKSLKKMLAKAKASFTHAEVAGMALALLENVPGSDAQQQTASLLVGKHLLERLHENTAALVKKEAAKSEEHETKVSATKVFQFKITLNDIEPPIWRRIQTKDCTLDKLHEHIQTAMGWTNSHLHQFEIGGVRHGDPELIYEGWVDETPPVDSRRLKLSKIIPKDGKRFSFQYEYDFGDGWEHEILFEGFPTSEKGVRYPLCVEGERACPPEDVGGVRGYKEYLRALANPKHKRHKEFMRWNGPFDPKSFDAQAATTEMRKGLPDWRNEA